MNEFKHKLASGQKLYGLWLGSASGYMAQIAAQAGYDWCLIDGEHAPNTIASMQEQLVALECFGASPIVRILNKEVHLVKQALDIGAQTLLVPMVDTREQAELMAQAVRYPPEGVRGVGGYIIRAARWGAIPEYQQIAEKSLCLILQCESKEGLENLDSILQVSGVDSVFIGPADLSASLGFASMREAGFQRIWFDALRRIKAAGKYAGTLALDEELARAAFMAGADYIGVCVDVMCYLKGLKDTLAAHKARN